MYCMCSVVKGSPPGKCRRHFESVIFKLFRPTTQITQSIRQISHNALFCSRNVHTSAHFCYKMVHCGIWDWCMVGFVEQFYCSSTRQQATTLIKVHLRDMASLYASELTMQTMWCQLSRITNTLHPRYIVAISWLIKLSDFYSYDTCIELY